MLTARGQYPFDAPDWLTGPLELERRLASLRLKGEKFPAYQFAGMRYLASARVRCLWDDQGLGKTVEALLALPNSIGTLAIVPAGLQRNWRRECERWRPDLRAVELERKTFAYPQRGEFAIARWESLPARPPGGQPEFLLLVDEAQYGKTDGVARTRRARLIRKRAVGAWLLSGTPLENQPCDLFSLYMLAGLAPVLGEDSRGWVKRFYVVNGKGKATGAHPEAADLTRALSLRRTKKQVAHELPPKRFTRLYVAIGKAAISRQIQTLFARYGGEAGLIAKLTAESLPAAERQEIDTATMKIRRELAMAKLPYALEWSKHKEDEGELPIVFCCHRDPIIELGKRPGWMSIVGGIGKTKRQEAIDKFQARQLKGLAVSLAGAEGITLTASATMLRMDRDWRPSKNLQITDRLHRHGQKRAVLVVDLFAEDAPLDFVVFRVCEIKAKVMKASGLGGW